ncbi:MAG: acyltransferase [Candidatus Gastranaerophilaceae bacterium]
MWFFEKKNIKIQGKNNIIKTLNDTKIPQGLNIDIKGDNNRVLIGDNINFRNSTIKIYSSNNIIEIYPTKHLVMLDILINHGNNQKCIINKNFSCAENTKIWLIEPNCSVEIGEDCMLSTDVHFIASDGHCIFDDKEKLINYSDGIKLGNHVWCGTHTRFLKNTKIPDGSIVGTCAVVAKDFTLSGGGFALPAILPKLLNVA